MKKLIFIVAGLVLLSCNKGRNNPGSCNGGSTRRDIKLVIDDAAMDVDTIPIITTVDSIGSIELIEVDSDTERQEIEMKTFTVTAKVDKVSKHRDGDYKIKLVSENEKYLNCEAPNTGCAYAGSSRFFKEFKEVRAFIEQYMDSLEGKTLTITGVAFIDIDHKYPRNTAENEIELHPVLKISF